MGLNFAEIKLPKTDVMLDTILIPTSYDSKGALEEIKKYDEYQYHKFYWYPILSEGLEAKVYEFDSSYLSEVQNKMIIDMVKFNVIQTIKENQNWLDQSNLTIDEKDVLINELNKEPIKY